MENTKLPLCTVAAEEVARVKGFGFLRDKNTADKFNCRVLTVNGKVSADFLRTIAEATEKFGSGEAAFTSRMTVEIQGIPYENIDEFIAFINSRGLECGGTGPKVRPVVSCKGTTCQYGLIDTFGLSRELHERFYVGYHDVKLPHKFKIAVGGCPNNCVKPDINDLGIIGQKVPVVDENKCVGCQLCVKACPIGNIKIENKKAVINDETCNHCGRCIPSCKLGALSMKQQGYRVYIGGRWGKKVARGIPFSKILDTDTQVLDVIEKTINFYKDNGTPGERFADTIARLGFENVQKDILG